MQVSPRINWFGLAGGATTLALTAISIFVPWWQLRVGDSLIAANVSPLYTNFNLAGNTFTIPAILAVNISCILLSLIGAVLILVYSMKPTKSYAKTLLNLSFATPLIFVVIFTVALLALSYIIQTMYGFNFPIVGSANVQLPSNTTGETSVSVQLTAEFLLPFYLAVVSSVLCIAARIYHKLIPKPATNLNATQK